MDNKQAIAQIDKVLYTATKFNDTEMIDWMLCCKTALEKAIESEAAE